MCPKDIRTVSCHGRHKCLWLSVQTFLLWPTTNPEATQHTNQYDNFPERAKRQTDRWVHHPSYDRGGAGKSCWWNSYTESQKLEERDILRGEEIWNHQTVLHTGVLGSWGWGRSCSHSQLPSFSGHQEAVFSLYCLWGRKMLIILRCKDPAKDKVAPGLTHSPLALFNLLVKAKTWILSHCLKLSLKYSTMRGFTEKKWIFNYLVNLLRKTHKQGSQL